MSPPARRNDRTLLASLLGSVLLLIVGIAVFAPRAPENNPRPTTENTDARGARAAFLTLQAMGRTAVRWDEDSAHIPQLDAPHTTLVLANPEVALASREALAERLKDFMERGGRVLVTGDGWRASLLPGGKAEAPKMVPELCETTPEGPGALAAAGSVEMEYQASWAAPGPQFRVEQRCGSGGVVVRLPVGAGEAIWWSSAAPLTNAGLKHDANLRLLLASLGQGRAAYFDEYYFGQHAEPSLVHADRRVYWALFWQFVAVFVLLVWSFSRRKGPLRMPVEVPRSSPVEFAESMGGLYAKARATEPVVEAAERRLARVLMSEAGLSREVVRDGPDAVAAALAGRFGGDWSGLQQHLAAARAAKNERVSPGDALTLVRGMAGDEDRLRAMLSAGMAKAEAARDERAVSASEEYSTT